MSCQIGDPAPGFKGLAHNGEEIDLSTFLGKKVVLYFYPKDNTPGCTRQACNLRDYYQELLEAGYYVIGVSNDSVASHQRFGQKYHLPFPLISDKEGRITSSYCIGKGDLYSKRTTFIIDEKGIIERIIKNVKTDAHSAQILGK